MDESFLYPLPPEKLLGRFQPAFDRITKGGNTTLLALPHTGRTSNLRFIHSQPSLLKELGVDKQKIIFIDANKTTGTIESFASEILINLTDNYAASRQSISSSDPYVITSEIFHTLRKIDSRKRIILIVTLNDKLLPILSEIDTLIIQIQRMNQKIPINILWSVDTLIYRNFNPSSSSSSFYDSKFLYKTFDKEDTIYSFKRISNLKSRNLNKKILADCMKLTGGIAGLFHPVINLIDSNEEYYSNARIVKVLRDIKRDVKKVDIGNQLIHSKHVNSLLEGLPSLNRYLDIRFKNTPKAQELQLLKMFTDSTETPVSRDEIAQNLWGKRWRSMYSDWAIDKAIQRLRENIDTEEYKIITIRNLGYQLTKLQ